MTLNQFGVTAEANDRLLELVGGCRHEWVKVRRSMSMPGGRAHEWDATLCSKCPAIPNVPEYGQPYEENRVGDGHAVTLGEMVRLCAEMPHSPSINYHYAAHAYASEGHRVTLTWYPLDRGGRWAHGEGATPEAALAAAILAAVDADKAKE